MPKPKARRRCTPAPSRVGLDFMSRFTGRIDIGTLPKSRPSKARNEHSRTVRKQVLRFAQDDKFKQMEFQTNTRLRRHLCAALEKREEIGIDLVRVGGGHSVRKTWIHLERRPFHQLRGLHGC